MVPSVVVTNATHVGSLHFYADTMTDADSNTAPEASVRVADGLRTAFADVAAADVAAEVKGRWQRRLIAITNMAKHDVARADVQLNKFHDEWNAAKKTLHDGSGH